MTAQKKEPGSAEVVGHKTHYSPERGYWHTPLTRAEADALLAQIEASDKRRKELMPDEDAAIRMFCDAHQRLKEFGWREIFYAPKDGEFLVIEPGSTGKHRCVYMEIPTRGSYWIQDEEGGSPSHPALFKPLEKTP